MIQKMANLTPLLKVKTDELFLQWFLDPETQKQLRNDFRKIKNKDSPSSSPILQTKGIPNNHLLGARPLSPPSTPPLSSTPPGKSPSSPRRRTLSTISTTSTSDGTSSRKGSTKSRSKRAKKPDIVPGCAKDLPQFYFPFGKPNENLADEKAKLKFINRVFAKLTNGKATCAQLGDVVEVKTHWV